MSRLLPKDPPCPFCRGVETELISPFGAHASVASYWCRRCRSPFEFMRWGTTPQEDDRDAPVRSPGDLPLPENP